METLEGQLLIASPGLTDDNFVRTVVAVAHHDDDGALGIVLNRPSATAVTEAVPELEGVMDPGQLVHFGGPVHHEAIVVLAEFNDPADAAYLVSDRIGLVSDRMGIGGLQQAAGRCRVYAGYAGWGPGQLESELEREDWIVDTVHPDDVFSEDPDHLWASVLDRKGGNFRLLARFPDDPSLN
ncbi:MAG TPA: YqgE/AlgH family protein [Baekduia sp.]|nr:YqgE/AlgH family protein [Baekduia sp.]